jgi:hypothetical protein
MKELRFKSNGGVWRVAFDPKRNAVVLVAGDKSGSVGEAVLCLADRHRRRPL